MLKIIEKDSWLNPVADAAQQRYDRYQNRLKSIEKQYGSLGMFASAHLFFGFHYDRMRRGWWYREWAPGAHYMSIFGDFNDWNRYSHPLENDGHDVWTIFLPDSEYKTKLTHGSLLKVLVQSSIGWCRTKLQKIFRPSFGILSNSINLRINHLRSKTSLC